MSRPDKRVVMVAAVADNGVIGLGGDIPWHISEDLKHFRETTRGNTVVMGRTTYEGIGHPLPYRTNVVVTRTPGWHADGVFVAGSIEEALELARGFDGDIMIGGGTQVYAAAMPYATHQVLTEVHVSPAGDTHYPEFDRSEWRETRREERDGYAWVWLERAGR
ncbi:MAG: dihydrofolate reductase [Nocardioidaceae bacterium]|nr:dihydrofolate reductase [Nocardioidaceae bacterium]NUS52273.1 dihydrofolate reductase [Nocardioidaceae bacterium]